MKNFLSRLIGEIHRRSLWQVLTVYLVGSYGAYQAIDSLVEGLKLPEWLPGFAIVLFLIGLPIVLATAMVQEGPPRAPWKAEPAETTAGSQPAARADLMHHRVFTWRNALVGGAMAFAAWGVVAAALMIRNRQTTNADVSVGRGAAGRLSLNVEPAGVRAVALLATDSAPAPIALGKTPVAKQLPAGEYIVSLQQDGYQPLDVLVRVSAKQPTVVNHTLVAADAATAGMVFVPAGRATPNAPETTAAFLLDRYEVTNEQYAAFIAAGGYTNSSYWPAQLTVRGELLPWSAAIGRFVDRTGMPGPRGWSGGVFPQGKANHPVVGVSWYEASAYARWAGKQLPETRQWWRGALGGAAQHYPWGDDVETLAQRANFGLIDTTPVGSLPRGLSPYGAHDLAGNVREWLRDTPAEAAGDRRAVVGGAWSDPSYMFEAAHTEFFPPDYANDTIGFRCVRALPSK